MSKKTNIIAIIIYFIILTIFPTTCLYMQMSAYYNFLLDEEKNIENELQESPSNENTENNTTTKNTLIEIEKTFDYRIYVDTTTRNMYLKDNNYDMTKNSFTLMYDGENPKIYTGEINGETYEEFLSKNKQN